MLETIFRIPPITCFIMYHIHMQFIVPVKFRLSIFWVIIDVGPLQIQSCINYCDSTFHKNVFITILVLQISLGWTMITVNIWFHPRHLVCTQQLYMYWLGPFWASTQFLVWDIDMSMGMPTSSIYLRLYAPHSCWVLYLQVRAPAVQ